MMRFALLALFAPSAYAFVVAVSHAAGRMGVSVVGQLREQWQICKTHADDRLHIRAIVRNEAEANRVRLDLCGAVLRDGILMPLVDLESDLGIQMYVVPDDVDESVGLSSAFEGADVAVLLSAAHADFSPAASDEAALSTALDVDSLVPGTKFMQRATAAFEAAVAAAGTESMVNVRVPPVAGAAAARRLGAEIAAATMAKSMRHIVLRSSMGVGALQASVDAGQKLEGEARQRATTAVTCMGGSANIAAQADAESALLRRCSQRDLSTTILRLGALVDSAGGVPLVFGHSDGQLFKRISQERSEPPLISRNDAARLLVEVLLRGLEKLDGAIFDAAWGDEWGISSAGAEEAARSAARQDLVGDAALGLATSSNAGK